jgi:hypothetical protein
MDNQTNFKTANLYSEKDVIKLINKAFNDARLKNKSEMVATYSGLCGQKRKYTYPFASEWFNQNKKKNSDCNFFIEFIEFLNSENICGCVILIPESVVKCFEDWKGKKEKEELLNGNKF